MRPKTKYKDRGDMRSRIVRLDLYYGWDDEKNPKDKIQLLFDVVADDIDEISEVATRNIQDAISKIVNEHLEG